MSPWKLILLGVVIGSNNLAVAFAIDAALSNTMECVNKLETRLSYKY